MKMVMRKKNKKKKFALKIREKRGEGEGGDARLSTGSKIYYINSYRF